MINSKHPLSLSRQAELKNISRGAVYCLPKPSSERDLALINAIYQLHLDFPFMGSRQLCRALVREGHQVGRLHVRSLMRTMGFSALAPQLGTSQRNPQHKVFPCLLRKLPINLSNQVWALDTTTIRMARGFAYLAAVVNVCRLWFLAIRIGITLKAIHSADAIQGAYRRFGKPEILNAD
jgi:putative transposase